MRHTSNIINYEYSEVDNIHVTIHITSDSNRSLSATRAKANVNKLPTISLIVVVAVVAASFEQIGIQQ